MLDVGVQNSWVQPGNGLAWAGRGVLQAPVKEFLYCPPVIPGIV